MRGTAAREQHRFSERRACRLLGQWRGTQRYITTQRDEEDALTRAIVELASQYGRYGYRRITAVLQRAGWNVGRDRVQRISTPDLAAGRAESTGNAEAARPAVAARRFVPTASSGTCESRLELRLCQRLHPRWTYPSPADADRLTVDPRIPVPILVTTNRIILAGFGRWPSALFDDRHEINCIEYPLSEDEALQFVISHRQSQRGWNAYIRIRLALTLKHSFRQRALDNMSTGGKYKGLAKLPDLQRIDVRQEIANLAGVCSRTVGNVETILETAHPRLLEALRDSKLKIGRAMHLCKLRRAEQLEQFIRYSEERATNKVIRWCIPQLTEKEASLDIVAVLDALQHQEARQPGSVAVRVGRHKRTVVLVGRDLFCEPHSQKELKLT